MPEIQTQAPPQPPSFARYNLAVLAFFVITLTSQVLLAHQYIRLLPESLRGMLQAVVVLGFGVQSALLVAVIPLAMIFIFGWLYLSNVQVKVRQLYPIVVVAISPLIIFMFFSLAYLLTARSIEPSVRERMATLSQSLEQELGGSGDPAKMNPARFQELGTILKDDMTRRWAPINKLIPLPLVASCLVCGWMLTRKLSLGTVRAYLIPATFIVSVVLVRWLSASPSQQMFDRFKNLPHP